MNQIMNPQAESLNNTIAIIKNFFIVLCLLIDVIINIKHYSIFGAHASIARITRDIQENFYVQRDILNSKLKSLVKHCYLCQIFQD